MKKLCTLLLAAAALSSAQDPPAQPDQVLYANGIMSEALHKPEQAQLALRTLTLTYPDSRLAARASKELAAIALLVAARSDIADGRFQRAALSLETLVRTYPDSLLALQAADTLQSIR